MRRILESRTNIPLSSVFRTLCFAMLAGLSPMLTAESGAQGASSLSGVWKNDDRAVWLEITQVNDVATGHVQRNDERPEAVGRAILREVRQIRDRQWQGQIYVERMGRFQKATISLRAPDAMTISVRVGPITRSVNWSRVTL